MLDTDIPAKFNIPFAEDAGAGFVRDIPEASQIGINDGFASLETGFPPLNFLPRGAGGVPPFGQDVNGILKQTTAWARWFSAGGPVVYDGAFASAIGGYPKGALLSSTTLGRFWLSTVDSNTTDPDSVSAADWIDPSGNTILQVTGTSNTYTNAQVGQQIIRSNSGGAMIDTLPGTGPGVLFKSARIQITNGDGSGLLVIGVGSGASILGAGSFLSNGRIFLGPGQTAQFLSDGANYWLTSAPERVVLAASTTIYVTPTGDDSNNGLTVGTAYLTLQQAYNWVVTNIDCKQFVLTIQVGDGVYAAGIDATGLVLGKRLTGSVVFRGNPGSPASCFISVSSATPGFCFGAGEGARFSINGFQLSNPIGNCIFTDGPGSGIGFENVNFGSAANHISATNYAQVTISGNYSIASGASNHWNVQLGASLLAGGGVITVTLTGTPNFSGAFAQIGTLSTAYFNSSGLVFAGSAAGKRYNVDGNSMVNSNGAGATYLPGNGAGTTANGGIYG